MQVSREKLLCALSSISPGLSSQAQSQGMIAQADCFVFKDGKIHTFNDEIACVIDSPAPEVEGAVVAKPLLELLSKLTEDVLQVVVTDGKLRIKGKRRRAELVMESEIELATADLDLPDEWKSLDPEFLEAVSIVKSVANTSADASFNRTCLHITSKHVEASDYEQVIRYPVVTALNSSYLVRQFAIKHIPALGMSEFAESDVWLHFRNPMGLIFSCRCWQEEYESLDSIFMCSGDPVALPTGLEEAVAKAKIFSKDAAEDLVFVRMSNNRFLLRGEGSQGKFEEQKQIAFKGDIAFMIPPKILVDITKRTMECLVGSGRLRVDAGKYVYITCLSVVDDE